MGGASLGNYSKDYRLRATANFAGIWANTWDEAMYFVATRDVDEKPLNGSNNYVIHFAAGKLPSAVVDAYWSVILVSVPDYRVVPNPLNRFNLNSHSPWRANRRLPENRLRTEAAAGSKKQRAVAGRKISRAFRRSDGQRAITRRGDPGEMTVGQDARVARKGAQWSGHSKGSQRLRCLDATKESSNLSRLDRPCPSCTLIISQDHYAPMVVYGKGSYTLTQDKNGTRYVMTAVRTLTKRIG